MSKAANYRLGVAITATDGASSVLKRVDRSLKGTGSALDKVQGKWRMSSVFGALEKLTDKTKSLSSMALNAGTKLAAMGSVAGVALGAIVQRVTSAGDKTIKFSRQIGLNVERLQEWRYAAEQAGIPADSFDKALAKLGLRAAQARAGVGEARDYFKALGISMTDAAGNGRALEDLLPEIADKIAAIQDPNARGVFLGKFFDDEGVALERMLNKGSAGLADMATRARELGVVASAETLGGFEEFQGTIGALKAQLAGLSTEIISRLMPSLQKAAGSFSEWLAANREGIAEFVTWLTVTIPSAIEELDARITALKRDLPRALTGTSAMNSRDERINNASRDDLEEALRRARQNVRSGLSGQAPEVPAGGGRSLDDKIEAFLYPNGFGRNRATSPPSEVRVSFSNTPPGTRVEADRAARRMVDLDVGYAMPGVGR